MATTASQAQNSEFQSAGKPVANPFYLVDQNGIPVVPFSAGTQNTQIAAGVATDTVIKPAPGRLCRILITTAGTNAVQVFDNAGGHTGAIIGYVAASAVAGTIVDSQWPALNGITVQGNASNPAMTISWS